ncbi:MAG TPA: M2 family metallopeptidase [Gemmatales bacterium]|nr:M2 family metallopeptidase [Gemmatales bacterium]
MFTFSRKQITLAALLVTFINTLGLAAMPYDADADAKAFIADHEARIKQLEKLTGLTWWNANISGKDDDFKKKEEAQNKLDAALGESEPFAKLKQLKANMPKDPLLARQIELLYLQYLEKQVDKDILRQMTAKANAVEQAFNVFRAKVRGKELSDSQVREVLKKDRDPLYRKEVWEASKLVGANVEADLRALAKLRNQSAKQLGFGDFHKMMLHLNEQDQAKVLSLFDELDTLTHEPYQQAKAEIDAALAKNYNIKPEELMPWHYQDPFFQEPPDIYDVSLDDTYSKVDILKLCRQFYSSIGLPIDDVLARSDLYEKSGKSPHAFCTDIDREGDVRVLGNIVPKEYWMGTMLHELGHSVYSSKNIPASVPYVLRAEAHILTTEGVAMQFEKFSKNAAWLASMGVKVEKPEAFDATAKKMQRNQLLIFSRWCQVMLRFEAGLYADPDQDLNKLWWDLVEKYQGLKHPAGRNAPDFGAKVHICTAPAYYHNYMMGQLFASQVHHALCRDVLKVDPKQANYTGNPAVGQWMKDKVFTPGRTYTWNGLTKFATGEELNAKAFASDFGGK